MNRDRGLVAHRAFKKTACRALLVAFALAIDVSAQQPAPINGPRELFALYGCDASYFSKLRDGVPLDDDQTEAVLRALFALRRFRREDIARWQHPRTEFAAQASNLPGSAGELVVLRGRVRRVVRERPSPEAALRFELAAYFRCELELSQTRQHATVMALEVPRAWIGAGQDDRTLDERCGCTGAILKRSTVDPADPSAILIAQRMEWYPDRSEGQQLGDLGFDVSLFDGVRDKTPLAQSSDLEREAFYQMLAVAGGTKPGALHADAARRIETNLATWKQTIARGDAGKSSEKSPMSPYATAVRALERAEKDGADDVVPLFVEPGSQRGRLLTLAGTARRAIEIRVDDADIRARYGITRYFEVELFPPDSQSNPVVFCVRELPAGMPQGESIHEEVRATGFFLKSWAFRSSQSAAPQEAVSGGRRQLAPLLIGRDVVWIPTQTADQGGGLLIGAVVGVVILLWATAWWLHRDARRHSTHTLPDRITPPAK